MRVEAAGGVARRNDDLFERDDGLRAAAVCGHQAEPEHGLVGDAEDRAERHGDLAAGKRREHSLHRRDAPGHVERRPDVVLAQHEHAHRKVLSSASRSPSSRVTASASRTGARCSSRLGPTTTAVISGTWRSHAIASAAIVTPRPDAALSNASSASNVASVRYPSLPSGRSVMRDPAGNGSPRRYLPVSQPPASGLNGVYPRPCSWHSGKTVSRSPRSSSEYPFCTHS